MQISIKACYKLILWFLWGWSSIPKVLKIASLQRLYNISDKKLEMKSIFCMQASIKFSHKLISTLWASKFPIMWYYHYWWAWWSILKVLKITILHDLYNISKKVKNEVHICMQVNIKVCKSWHFDGSGQTCPKNPK